MNILFILYTPRFSGAEIVIENIIFHNKKINYQILAGYGYVNTKLKNILTFKYIRALYRNKGNIFTNFQKILGNLIALNYKVFLVAKKNNFGFIHIDNIQLAAYLIPFMVIKRIFHLSYKTIWHNQNLFYEEKISFEILEEVLVRLFDITIVPSNAVREKFRSKKKIKTLYSGVDLSKFNFSNEKRSEIIADLGLSNNKVVIGIFGLICKKKGQLGLINVYINLVRSYENLHLLIIGKMDESNEDFVEKFNNQLNKINENKITVLNWVNNIEDYYSAVDIVINNTQSKYSEPLGTTIIEGMASECIVLASNTGGTPEIIDDGFDGFLFEVDNKDSLESKVIEIIPKINSLDYIRKNARKKVGRKFNINQTVENYNKILNDLQK